MQRGLVLGIPHVQIQRVLAEKRLKDILVRLDDGQMQGAPEGAIAGKLVHADLDQDFGSLRLLLEQGDCQWRKLVWVVPDCMAGWLRCGLPKRL